MWRWKVCGRGLSCRAVCAVVLRTSSPKFVSISRTYWVVSDAGDAGTYEAEHFGVKWIGVLLFLRVMIGICLVSDR